jgi:hypothetical protein
MAFDALAVGGIAAFAYLNNIDITAIDIIDIMAVEADFGNTVLRIRWHILMADIAGNVIRVFEGVRMAVLIMAVEASCGDTVLGIRRHLLMTDIAGPVVRVSGGVVVTVFAGSTVQLGGKVGFVVEENFARHGPIHDAKGLVR